MCRGAIRRGDWKLVWRTPLPAKAELFDLKQDPGETRNVAAEHPEVVAELQKRIGDLAGEMKPSLFFEATFKAYLGRHAGAPVFPNTEAFFEQGD